MARILHTIGAHVARLSRFTEDRFGVSVEFHRNFSRRVGWVLVTSWDPDPAPEPFRELYRKGARLSFNPPVTREPSAPGTLTLTFRSPVQLHHRGF